MKENEMKSQADPVLLRKFRPCLRTSMKNG